MSRAMPPVATLPIDSADLYLVLTGTAPPGLRAASLESLLTRGERVALPEGDLHESLWGLAGMPIAGSVPVAAVTRLGLTGTADDGRWLFGDPVTLLPARDRVLLADAAPAVEADEADRLIAAFNDLFATDGWRLERYNARWLLRTPLTKPLHTVATPRAAGQDIDPLLPRGEERLLWHRFLAEVQMLFHTHPVNAEREARGLGPINSLWPWGAGSLPSEAVGAVPTLAGEEPFLHGIARLAGGEPVAARFDVVVARTPGVVLIDAPLADVEEAWALPLVSALKKGDLTRACVMIPAAGLGVTTTRRDLGRWWRRRRPLTDLLGIGHVGA